MCPYINLYFPVRKAKIYVTFWHNNRCIVQEINSKDTPSNVCTVRACMYTHMATFWCYWSNNCVSVYSICLTGVHVKHNVYLTCNAISKVYIWALSHFPGGGKCCVSASRSRPLAWVGCHGSLVWPGEIGTWRGVPNVLKRVN